MPIEQRDRDKTAFFTPFGKFSCFFVDALWIYECTFNFTKNDAKLLEGQENYSALFILMIMKSKLGGLEGGDKARLQYSYM